MHAHEIRLRLTSALAQQPAVPAHTHARLDRHAHRPCGQDALAVGIVLCGKQLHTGHRDDAGADACGLQHLAGLERDFNLGPGGHQDGLPFTRGFGQHIGSLGRQVLPAIGFAHRRQVLA